VGLTDQQTAVEDENAHGVVPFIESA
jgi:hypothetical protein